MIPAIPDTWAPKRLYYGCSMRLIRFLQRRECALDVVDVLSGRGKAF